MIIEVEECPFCRIQRQEECVLMETEDAIALADKNPVSIGHSLIIPKRHCMNYFELTRDEQSICWEMINEVKSIIGQRYNPDGFNIRINIDESAGQTIGHVHIHLVPSYKI